MSDTDTYNAIWPLFQQAAQLVAGSRGHRGTLWQRLPLSDLLALLHVKSERLLVEPREDDALDAINYAAFILWRIRAAQEAVDESDVDKPDTTMEDGSYGHER